MVKVLQLVTPLLPPVNGLLRRGNTLLCLFCSLLQTIDMHSDTAMLVRSYHTPYAPHKTLSLTVLLLQFPDPNPREGHPPAIH